MQKFLIIQTAFIGDVVLATPVIEKLHDFFPDAQIDFLLRKGNEQLLAGHPFIHELLIWDKKNQKQKNLFKLIARIRRNRYDVVINIQRFFATGLLTGLSGAGERIGFDKNPLSFLFTKKIRHQVGGDQAMHETLRNLQLIESFTDQSFRKPKLYPSPADFNLAENYHSGKFITVSPASVWFTKQYPDARWSLFLQQVPESMHVFLLGGPGDQEICSQIARDSGRAQIDVLAGKLSFLQSAALMSKAIMNFVNDSAPMHFASAMNASVTAVYCSTVPEFGFGPLSDVRHIVQIENSLYCRPCGLHGYAACPEKHFRCALDIRTNQLTAILGDEPQAL